jgi:hypothetical protein
LHSWLWEMAGELLVARFSQGWQASSTLDDPGAEAGLDCNFQRFFCAAGDSIRPSDSGSIRIPQPHRGMQAIRSSVAALWPSLVWRGAVSQIEPGKTTAPTPQVGSSPLTPRTT